MAATLALGTAAPVHANSGDFVAGAIIGGLLGAAGSQKSRKTTTRRARLSSTQEGKQIQASLNYFGFPAGTVDGQLGRKSREAVTNYQAFMGYPMTGALTTFEQELLITSYNRAQAGGQATLQMAANNPEGTRGLLKVFRAEMAGGTAGATSLAAAPTTTVVINPVQPAAPAQTGAMPSFASAAAPEAAPAIPNFMGSAVAVSLASHCNMVSLITNTNGGFVTQASMTDPSQALNEQFCLARTYAIAQGEELISKVAGFTPAQIATQCEALAPALADQVAGTARICLSVGYRTDNLDVALASSLLLVALGERSYGELLGHHLSQGVGTSLRADLAQGWYQDGFSAIEAGAPAVFAPGQPERMGLLKQASMAVQGGFAPQAETVVPVGGALPAFGVTQ